MVRAPVMELENILTEGSISALQDLYTSKELSITEAVAFFLARIEAVNRKGPSLNAVKTIASDAVQQARIADAEIAAGRARGPLHGIPVLLKDNILTADGMTASAGAAALQSFVPEREATLVTLLRRAGAIILGKTNLTEFADYVSEVMPSGYSGAGGMVINPHNEAFGRGQGSSVGSAAAVAAGLAPVAIGSETQNSIQTDTRHHVVDFRIQAVAGHGQSCRDISPGAQPGFAGSVDPMCRRRGPGRFGARSAGYQGRPQHEFSEAHRVRGGTNFHCRGKNRCTARGDHRPNRAGASHGGL
jgi:amidase